MLPPTRERDTRGENGGRQNKGPRPNCNEQAKSENCKLDVGRLGTAAPSSRNGVRPYTSQWTWCASRILFVSIACVLQPFFMPMGLQTSGIPRPTFVQFVRQFWNFFAGCSGGDPRVIHTCRGCIRGPYWHVDRRSPLASPLSFRLQTTGRYSGMTHVLQSMARTEGVRERRCRFLRRQQQLSVGFCISGSSRCSQECCSATFRWPSVRLPSLHLE